MRFVNVYLIGYFILVLGALAAPAWRCAPADLGHGC